VVNSDKITQYYGELVSKVNSLDNKVNEVLCKHEQDFLSAFKSHMYSVYNQLLELKKRTDEEELRFKREGKLNTL
jgi:hypothetical protein